jgi:hypothetical protein
MREAGFSDFDQRPMSEEQKLLSIDITFDDSANSQILNPISPNIF